MSEIDWSKPIEVYEYATGEPVADAEVVASALKGPHPYAVLWRLHGTDRVSLSTEGGVLYDTCWWGVRNKKRIRRKWVVLVVSKTTGAVVSITRETKEDAEYLKALSMRSADCTFCDVAELEWTEE